ncbi:gliding motility-associated C-terminal domain-containing protein [Solitalea sp. MAHUQ-68]|uniref:Gliding motility-associated C-terminal domain-containing protein n=1 Tax=Solitalea agri TaxID=2953739 RepID=A0A9X2F3E6_9SPHI|nr:MBG domain-containing protein [Solitalea agri]MCO4294059.1 gliding motility-associated C-terminal domain-containing protein [Solitalea agri]
MKKIYFFCILLLSIFLAFSAKTYAQNYTWRNVGPQAFPIDAAQAIAGQGRVTHFKFDPVNHNRIYAICGLSAWVSDNKGDNWKTLGTDKMPYLLTSSSICIDYTDNNVLYLGTGEPCYYGGGNGVWKSTDGGATFQPSNTGMTGGCVREILMDPTDHNTLVAATMDGIFRTTDAGATWTKIVNDKFVDMRFAPEPGSTTLYAVTYNNGIFYKSTDMGLNWTSQTINTLPNTNNTARVAVSDADPNVVYVSYFGSNNGAINIPSASNYGGVIYKSTDRGATFTLKKGDNQPNLVGYARNAAGQGTYNFDLVADPNNANTLYVCAHVIWKSTDGGVNWAQSYQTTWQKTIHTDMHWLRFNPYNSSEMYCATDGGFYLSKDNAVTWTPKTQGMANTQFASIANSPISKHLIAGGTQDNGELFYYNGVWTSSYPGDQNSVYYHDNFSDFVYLAAPGTVSAPVNAAKRDYKRWPNSNFVWDIGIDPNTMAPTRTNSDILAFSKFKPNQAFWSFREVWRSNNIDAGPTPNNTSLPKPTWTKIYTKVPNTLAMAQSPADSNALFVLGQDKKIYRSYNVNAASPSFSAGVSAPQPSGNASTGALAVFKNGVMYMASNGYAYRTTDDGTTWTAIGSGPVTTRLNSENIENMVADTTRQDIEAIYAQTGRAVYYKDNTMTDWALYSDGLPSLVALKGFDIFYDKDNKENSLLRLGTYGRGAWECFLVNSTPDQTNTPPVVNISSMVDGESLYANQSIKLTSKATDLDGHIVNVEYFYNGKSIGKASQLPYAVPFTVPNLSGEQLTITAVATDDKGLQGVSAPVKVTLTEPLCGSSSFIAPQSKLKVHSFDNELFFSGIHTAPRVIDNNKTLAWNTNYPIVPTQPGPYPPFPHWIALDLGADYSVNQFMATWAAAGDGRVKDYEFYVSMDPNDWGEPVAKGSFENTADDKLVTFADKKGRYVKFVGLSGHTAVPQIALGELYVGGCPYNEPPVVSISSPSDNQKFGQSTGATIEASATDANGSVAKVEWFEGTTILGESLTSPYTYTFNSTVPGTYKLRAVATDNLGAKAAAYINVTIFDDILPVINTVAGALDATLQCSDATGLTAASAMVPVATDNVTVNPELHLVSDNTVRANDVEFVRTRVWNFTDEAGNVSDNYTQVIKVIDDTFPVLTGTQQVHHNFSGLGTYTVPAITSTDNCGIKTLTYEITGATTRSGSGLNASGNFNEGESTIIWTAVDNAGNESTFQTDISIGSKPGQTINFAALTAKTYGDLSFDLTGTSTADLSLTYSSSDASIASINNNTVTIHKAGTVTITASQDGDAYYKAATPVSRTLTVGKANLTVSADNMSKTYGDVNPDLTVSYSGFVNGDNVSNLASAATASTSAIATSAAGNYVITASGAASSNYTFVYQNGTLTVNKANLTVIADNKSKTYGAANPALTISYSGFVNGENVSSLTSAATVSTNATAASGAGTYPITVNGAASSNYMLIYQNGTLTIDKAVLTVNANNQQMCQGNSLPALTISYSGFVNGENPANLQTAPSINTTANATSAAGTYSLTPAGGVSNNYIFNYVNGSLTINDNPQLSISSNRLQRIYKGDIVELKAEGSATKYEWDEAAGILSGRNSAVLTVRPMQTTTFMVRAYNASGCYVEQLYTIEVLDGFKKEDVSNVLTPNDDGKNDKWMVRNIELYPNNMVKIIDKTGRLIYTKKGYLNEWDGTFNGSRLQEGTYYYVIDLGNGMEPVKGFISIVRN